jgi:uncharacterized integral membrane protein
MEEQLSIAGISYGRRHDLSYRTGLVLQALGAGLLAMLYPLESPFYSAGIMLFDLGMLLAAVYLLVWMSWIKKIILGAVLIGIPVQIIGLHVAPPQYAGSVILIGIGLVCVGGAGMVGKEAYCFGYREGWMLMWLYPIVVLVNLAARENRVFNSLAFSAAFLLLLSLTGKKLKQPLLTSCPTTVCGTPEKKSE